MQKETLYFKVRGRQNLTQPPPSLPRDRCRKKLCTLRPEDMNVPLEAFQHFGDAYKRDNILRFPTKGIVDSNKIDIKVKIKEKELPPPPPPEYSSPCDWKPPSCTEDDDSCTRPEKKPLEHFTCEQAKSLCRIARQVYRRGKALIEFIDFQRFLSMQAGIETIGIEVASLINSERVERLLDALDDAVEHEEGVDLTPEGLGMLKQVERLLAEAANNISRFTNAASPDWAQIGDTLGRPALGPGQARGLGLGGSNIDLFSMVGAAAVLFGALALAVLVIKLASKD